MYIEGGGMRHEEPLHENEPDYLPDILQGMAFGGSALLVITGAEVAQSKPVLGAAMVAIGGLGVVLSGNELSRDL